MQYLFYWVTHLWLKSFRDRFVYVYMHFFLFAKAEMNNYTASFFELALLTLFLIGQLKNSLKYWLYVNTLVIRSPLLFAPRLCLTSPKALFRSKLQDISFRDKWSSDKHCSPSWFLPQWFSHYYLFFVTSALWVIHKFINPPKYAKTLL